MNNIGLIISGNLTGFSHFYDSPVATQLFSQAKFDFDFRNFLTFLRGTEKVYAISFAPQTLAISLVTRILDSYRRPGVLVVSLVVPRKKRIASIANPQNKNAVYDLLNAVNAKFYERNFINGMLNQNAAVLMQDYYADILSAYTLADDPMQRNVSPLDVPPMALKRSGYVQSQESDVASYLDTPCRKSYDGYNDVFFAVNAPKNIDEPPVEEIIYNVHVTNTGMRLQNVKLTDKVYNQLPSEGEQDIDKNYTYQQVLNGEAGKDIMARVTGDTIDVTYRFREEERAVTFVFSDGANTVPFASVLPVLEMGGREYPVASETYTFIGREIYAPKRLRSNNQNFEIKNPVIDIRRVKNGAEYVVMVERASVLNLNFSKPYDRKKTVTLRHITGSMLRFECTSQLNEKVPGRLEDYSYNVESEYYETAMGQLKDVLVNGLMPLKVRQSTTKPIVDSLFGDEAKRKSGQGKGKPASKPSSKTKGTDETALAIAVPATEINNTKGGGKSKNMTFISILAAVVIALLVFILNLTGVLSFKSSDEPTAKEDSLQNIVKKEIRISIVDKNEKALDENTWKKIKREIEVGYVVDGKETMLDSLDVLSSFFKDMVSVDTTRIFNLKCFVREKGNGKEIDSKDIADYAKLNEVLVLKYDVKFDEKKVSDINEDTSAKAKKLTSIVEKAQADETDFENNKKFPTTQVRNGGTISYKGKSEKIGNIVSAYNAQRPKEKVNGKPNTTYEKDLKDFQEKVRNCENWKSLGMALGVNVK